MKDFFDHFKARRAIQERWEMHKDTPERWVIIRDAYALEMPRIMEAREAGGSVNPYFLDWVMTPIERLAWMDIRGMGIPLLPQFPIDRVFVDFGDPWLKIAVELDGAAYHDDVRDLARDKKLLELGWKVFRFKGRTAAKILPRPFDNAYDLRYDGEFERNLIDWGLNDSSGFFWALQQVYFIERSRYKDVALRILSNFQLANFDLTEDDE